jgi:hypothetical protein
MHCVREAFCLNLGTETDAFIELFYGFPHSLKPNAVKAA